MRFLALFLSLLVLLAIVALAYNKSFRVKDVNELPFLRKQHCMIIHNDVNNDINKNSKCDGVCDKEKSKATDDDIQQEIMNLLKMKRQSLMYNENDVSKNNIENKTIKNDKKINEKGVINDTKSIFDIGDKYLTQ